MIRDTIEDDCTSQDYEPGEPSGQCWSDGHYLCKQCKHYRADFNRNGQEYIDFVHGLQIGLRLTTQP